MASGNFYFMFLELTLLVENCSRKATVFLQTFVLLDSWFINKIVWRLFMSQPRKEHPGPIHVDNVSKNVLGYFDMILFFFVFLHPNVIGCRAFYYARFAAIVPVDIDKVSTVHSEFDLREKERTIERSIQFLN